jgi:hypothetical protein
VHSCPSGYGGWLEWSRFCMLLFATATGRQQGSCQPPPPVICTCPRQSQPLSALNSGPHATCRAVRPHMTTCGSSRDGTLWRGSSVTAGADARRAHTHPRTPLLAGRHAAALHTHRGYHRSGQPTANIVQIPGSLHTHSSKRTQACTCAVLHTTQRYKPPARRERQPCCRAACARTPSVQHTQ